MNMMEIVHGSFLDELEKIAKELPEKRVPTTYEGEKFLLLAKEKNLPPLIMRLLKKTPAGVTVTIDPEYKKNTADPKHRPNGFYLFSGDRIHLTSLNHDTLAHEMGHARNADELAGKLFQNKTLYPLFHLAPAAGLLGGIAANIPHPVVRAISIGAPFLLTAPALTSEAKASLNGHKILSEVGATKKQLEDYRSEMLGAFGSYARVVPSTALNMGLGGLLGALHFGAMSGNRAAAGRDLEASVEEMHRRRKAFGVLGQMEDDDSKS